MKTRIYLLLAVAALLMGCSATYTIPIDDVYYWPEAHNSTTSSSAASASSAAAVETTTTDATAAPAAVEEPAPAVEYLNVQDTTITIRVKK